MSSRDQRRLGVLAHDGDRAHRRCPWERLEFPDGTGRPLADPGCHARSRTPSSYIGNCRLPTVSVGQAASASAAGDPKHSCSCRQCTSRELGAEPTLITSLLGGDAGSAEKGRRRDWRSTRHRRSPGSLTPEQSVHGSAHTKTTRRNLLNTGSSASSDYRSQVELPMPHKSTVPNTDA